MSLTSKLITCCNDDFTLGMKFQSIAYLLSGNAHLYWILDLEVEVHSKWDLWTGGLRESKGNASFEVERVSSSFRLSSENLSFFLGGPACS